MNESFAVPSEASNGPRSPLGSVGSAMSITQRVRKYATVFSVSLAERLTYRTSFFLGTLMRFLPIVTTIFLWQAIFAGTKQTEIAGLTANGFVAYYLLVMVSRAFSSMPGVATGIALDIREGNIKKYLLQPVDMLSFLFVQRITHKIAYYSVAFIPFALVFIVCGEFFPPWPRLEVMVAFVISLLFCFVIGFCYEAIIGLTGFWVLEVSSLHSVMMTVTYIMSGHMFPLTMVPGVLGVIMLWTPFQYLAYFPATVWLWGDSWSRGELWGKIGIEILVAMLMLWLARILFERGLRRYSAFGG